ncbi:hypothetical protein [Gottfriedia acidiceleris]|uniref:hypothetical protein n=1 Tax=Gottfriedia acidiceleris TaxID=371036 RepID=UPI002FFE8A96
MNPAIIISEGEFARYVQLMALKAKGTLVSTLFSVWKSYQKVIIGIIAFIVSPWWILAEDTGGGKDISSDY